VDMHQMWWWDLILLMRWKRGIGDRKGYVFF
jgi:hypothetical protein